MENEIEKEEIEITESSSKKSMIGDLIISYEGLSYDGALIYVSPPGIGETKYERLRVGQAIEYEGDKYFYKVTLLAINKDDHVINVLVTKSKPQKLPELQENIIEESETSRKRIFQELINKHCTNLPACKFKYYDHYLDVKEKGFFKGSTIFKVIGNSGYLVSWPTLFYYEWDNIVIKVYSSLYFDDLIKVAREYSQLIGKKASVERCF